MDPITAANLAIALLPLITTGTTEFIAWIHSLRAAAQQADVWSDEQEQKFINAVRAHKNDPAWMPDGAAAA